MLIKVETESLLMELAGEPIEEIIGKDLVDEGKKYLGATKCHVRIVKLSKLEFEAKRMISVTGKYCSAKKYTL